MVDVAKGAASNTLEQLVVAGDAEVNRRTRALHVYKIVSR